MDSYVDEICHLRKEAIECVEFLRFQDCTHVATGILKSTAPCFDPYMLVDDGARFNSYTSTPPLSVME